MRTAYIRYNKATQEIVIKIASDEIWNSAIEAVLNELDETDYHYTIEQIRKLKK